MVINLQMRFRINRITKATWKIISLPIAQLPPRLIEP
jgi:hypothetical protein